MGNGPSNLTKIPISRQGGSGTMNASDFGFSDTIKIEHAFTFDLGEKWERPLRKVSESLAKMGYHWAESFRIIATGLSAYFVLAGLAKLVAATKSTDEYSKSKNRPSQHSSSRSKTGSTSKDIAAYPGEKSSHSNKTISLPSKTTEGCAIISKGNDTA